MRGRFDSELVCVSQWYNGRTPVRKTGDLRLKSHLRHNFFPQDLSYIGPTDIQNYNIKLESVSGMKLEKRENPEKTIKNSDIFIKIVTL